MNSEVVALIAESNIIVGQLSSACVVTKLIASIPALVP